MSNICDLIIALCEAVTKVDTNVTLDIDLVGETPHSVRNHLRKILPDIGAEISNLEVVNVSGSNIDLHIVWIHAMSSPESNDSMIVKAFETAFDANVTAIRSVESRENHTKHEIS